MMTTLQPPKNWQDFEELCFMLWSAKWGPGTQKNGRLGQAQSGVDFYGKQYPSDKFTGVQCKGKNNNYGKKLTKKEIERECIEAKKGTTKIEKLIFATTTPRDAKIQQYCRDLTESQQFGFDVEAYFWDDIEEELHYRPYLVTKLFEIEDNKGNILNLDYYITLGRISDFFTRPHIQNVLSDKLAKYLSALSFELADNACKYGKANSVILSIEDNIFTIKDNGRKFNPLDLTEGNGGYKTIKSILAEYGNDFIHYSRTETENVITISFGDVDSNESIKESCEFTMDLRLMQAPPTRVPPRLEIPQGVKTIVVNIIPPETGVPISIGASLIGFLLEKMSRDQHLKVYYPDGWIFINEIKENFEGHAIEYIERK